MEIVEFVEKVKQSIMEQLATEKKPGLVNPTGISSHVDMDYPLMLRGLTVINFHLFTLAVAGTMIADLEPKKAVAILKASGEAVEKELLEACNGRNVLKGTLFAIALFSASYFSLQTRKEEITEKSLSAEIQKIASELEYPKDTHGALIRESYGVYGAIETAKNGYRVVFDTALPIYRELLKSGLPKADVNRKVLLKLIATIDDTCLFQRQASLVDDAKKIADYVFNNYNEENLDAMCSYFARTSLSTGGSGDLLTLVILANKIFG